MPGVNVVPMAPGSFGEAMRIGEVLAESGFFKDTRSAAQAVVKMLAGRDLGLGPVNSMTGIYIVEGRVTLSAATMAQLIQRSGRFSYRIDQEHFSDTECVIDFFEEGEPVGRSAFTMGDATKAGLAGKDVWKKYPRNMLFGRAMSNGAKWYCPGVFGGPIYTPEELGAEVDAEGEIVSTTAATDAATPEAAPTPPPPPAPVPSPPAATSPGGEMGPSVASDGAPEAQVTEPQSVASDAADGPSATPVATQTPAELARSLGIADATQRFILIGIAGVEDATDLDAAYQTLTDEQLALVSAEWNKRAKP